MFRRLVAIALVACSRPPAPTPTPPEPRPALATPRAPVAIEPSMVRGSTPSPSDIAFDATALYVASRDQNRIVKLPRVASP